jgi:hypothetical protein
MKLNKKTIAAALALLLTIVAGISQFLKDADVALPEDAVEVPVVDAGVGSADAGL